MAARKKATPAGARPRRAYHHGDLRRALIDASLDLIERESLARLSLRAVARRVGVSHAAPKHHFGDLRGLMCAIAEEGFRTLFAEMTRARDAAAPEGALAAFQQIGMAYVGFATRHPGHFRAMFHPALADRAQRPSLREAADATYALLRDAIRSARDADAIRAPDLDRLALCAWSLVHGLAALSVDRHLENKGFSPAEGEALAEALTDQLYRGMHPE